jgi:serine/threonine protein kinase
MTVAVKRLHMGSKKDFQYEWSIANFLKNDPHITPLIGSFTQGDKYHLIFPWAAGNLREYWKMNDPPSRTLESAQWIASQVLGLAKALSHIHSVTRRDGSTLYGIHGDVKPENVLWFKNGANDGMGILKLADFGLGRFYTRRDFQSRKEFLTMTYRAPDSDTDSGLTSKSDMWSLGCVFLEFITWYLKGWESVEHVFPTTRVNDHEGVINTFKEDSFFNVHRDESRKALVAEEKRSVVKV